MNRYRAFLRTGTTALLLAVSLLGVVIPDLAADDGLARDAHEGPPPVPTLPVPTPTATALPVGPLNFVVNATDDLDDGTCDEVHCSLREALAYARGHAWPDTVTFDIPTSDPGYDGATGIWTIEPSITYNVPADTVVDGTMGASPSGRGPGAARPGIEIDGTTLAPLGYSGLRVADRVMLRGLIVNRFQYGIWVHGDNVTVENCYIGTDGSGASAKPNGMDGILVAKGATGAMIRDNLISGNSARGIRLFGDTTTEARIRDNRIGTDATGIGPLPNGGHGIQLHADAHGNTIGPGNTIAHNGGGGVEVDGPGTRANTITQNAIRDNTIGAILLENDANDGLGAPIISAATETHVSGTASPGSIVEVYSDAGGQGASYEGTTIADVGGVWEFLALAGLTGPNVTATASDGDGNTSEFSDPASLLQDVLFLPLVLGSD